MNSTAHNNRFAASEVLMKSWPQNLEAMYWMQQQRQSREGELRDRRSERLLTLSGAGFFAVSLLLFIVSVL